MRRLAQLTTLVCLLLALGVADTQAATQVSCGDIINAPGQYELKADCASTDPKKPAITISASHVYLYLKNHVMKSDTKDSAGKGIEVDNASDVTIVGPGKITNFIEGIFFDTTTNSSVMLVNSSGNQQGIHLHGKSINNLLTTNQTDSNGSNGIALEPESSNTRVYANSMCSNQTGITVNRGSMHNDIIGNKARGNGTQDLQDDNTDCGGNTWFANTFTRANQSSCIH